MVDLDYYAPHIIAWSVFMLSGCILLFTLFVLTSAPARVVEQPSSNPIVRTIYILFAFCNFTATMLIWTGNALENEPPFKLCLVNAAFTLANTPIMAACAFSLVAQVASTVLFIHFPTIKDYLGWVVKLPVLIALPVVAGLPFLIVGLHYGSTHQESVIRGSPFYCTIQSSTINLVVSIVPAILELLCLILALWTTIILARVRRKARSSPSRDVLDRSYNRPLLFRVLIFSLTNLMCFIMAIVSGIVSFAVVPQDLMFSLIGYIVVVIFGWPVIRSICYRCFPLSVPSRHQPTSSTSESYAMTIGTMPVFHIASTNEQTTKDWRNSTISALAIDDDSKDERRDVKKYKPPEHLGPIHSATTLTARSSLEEPRTQNSHLEV